VSHPRELAGQDRCHQRGRAGQRQRSSGLSCLEGCRADLFEGRRGALRAVRCAGQHGAPGLHAADAQRDQCRRARRQDRSDAAAPRDRARGLKAHASASRSRSPTACCSSPPTKPRLSPARSSSSTAATSPSSPRRSPPRPAALRPGQLCKYRSSGSSPGRKCMSVPAADQVGGRDNARIRRLMFSITDQGNQMRPRREPPIRISRGFPALALTVLLAQTSTWSSSGSRNASGRAPTRVALAGAGLRPARQRVAAPRPHRPQWIK
jgi:hypothetical protein